MPSVAVIIPMNNFNEMTKKCIDSIEQNAGIEHTIAVVDDGSKIPFEYPGVIRLEENRGFTAAVNEGLKCAKWFDYIAILNNDILPHKNFLKLLVDAMEADKTIGLAGSTRILKKSETYYENYGVDWITGYQIISETPLESDVISCHWMPFCSVLIRGSIIEEIGLLDKHLKNHNSDVDYCARILMAGYKVVLVTKSIVEHFHQTTTTANKLDPYEDQRKFTEKIAGIPWQTLLNELPLNCESKTWGSINFCSYVT